MIFNACDRVVEPVKLLWTNPNPDTGMSGTITFDIAKYKTLYVVSKSNATDSSAIISTSILINDVTLPYQICMVDTGLEVYVRRYTILENGVKFGNGTAYDMSNPTTGTGSSKYALPIYIYGSNPID